MQLVDLHEVLYRIAVNGIETDFLKIKDILRDIDKTGEGFEYYEKQTAAVIEMLKELMYIKSIKGTARRYKLTGFGYEDAFANQYKYGNKVRGV